MAKKKKNNTPRRKRMTREGRLQSGRQWIQKYEGKNIIKGYSNWYGVSEVTAILELKKLGMKIDKERLEKAKSTENSKAMRRAAVKQKKQERGRRDLSQDSDDTFYFIAGYTSGGFPYGLTWDEVDEETSWKNE